MGHFDSVNSYWGSRAINTTDNRWHVYIGQYRTTPAIMGFMMPAFFDFKFPDGTDIRKVRNVVIEDILLTAKGSNPESDFFHSPSEQYDRNRGYQKLSGDQRASLIPAYGIYFRHVENLTLKDVTTDVEFPDGRKAIVCENSHNILAENAPEVTMKP